MPLDSLPGSRGIPDLAAGGRSGQARARLPRPAPWARRLVIAALVLAVLAGLGYAVSGHHAAPLAGKGRPAVALAGLPLAFEPNVGQVDGRVKFIARAAGA